MEDGVAWTHFSFKGQVMSPPAALLASLEAASTREELLRACQRVCASTGVRSALLSAPPFFDFVARAVRATDPSDPELADAVEELLKYTYTGLKDVSEPPPGYGSLKLGDPRLERSILGLIGAIVDAAKRPRPRFQKACILIPKTLITVLSDQMDLEPNMCFSGPGLVELHRCVREFHTIVSGLEGMGPEDKVRAFLCVIHGAQVIGFDYHNVARREGLDPPKVLMSTLLRLGAFLGETSAPVQEDLLVDFGLGVSACGGLISRSAIDAPERDRFSLQLSDLPESRLADIARALGTCVARFPFGPFGVGIVGPVFKMLGNKELLPHACDLLKVPGCLGRIVQAIDDIRPYDLGLVSELLAIISNAADLHPARMAPLLRSSDFDRLVDMAFRPEAIQVVRSITYKALLIAYIVKSSGDTIRDSILGDLPIAQALAVVRRRNPVWGPPLPSFCPAVPSLVLSCCWRALDFSGPGTSLGLWLTAPGGLGSCCPACSLAHANSRGG